MSESLDHVIGSRPDHGGDPMGNAVVVAQTVHRRPLARSPRIRAKNTRLGKLIAGLGASRVCTLSRCHDGRLISDFIRWEGGTLRLQGPAGKLNPESIE